MEFWRGAGVQDGVVANRINWRLAVLRGDHDQSRVIEVAGLELFDKFADGCVNKLDFAQKGRRRSSSRIQIAACGVDALLDQFLANTDCLEVHPEDGGDLCRIQAQVVLAVDLVHDGVDLQSVIALEVLESVGPGGEDRTGVENGSAGYAGGSRYSGKSDNIRVDFRSVEVVQGAGAKAAGDRSVRGMLIRPCRVSASLMDHAEDAIGPDKLPRENGTATTARVARQLLGRFEERRVG